MKADYKNWMPKGMVTGTGCGTIASLVLFLILGVSTIVPEGSAKRVIGIVLLILTVIFCASTIWMYLMYRAFSYNGKRQMSKQIIEGVSECFWTYTMDCASSDLCGDLKSVCMA